MPAPAPLRYAVVGLGYISQVAMLPAFRNARQNSRLVALVSGSPRKLKALGRRYRVGMLHGYEEYDALLASGEVDAVYIGLPNTLHCDYAVRALGAGVHVLCDKPLATTVADCRRMLAAAQAGKARLMTAYRLHFEAGTLAAQAAIRSGAIGRPRYFSASFSMQVKPGNIRLDGSLGGGPLFDLGIYCINAARHAFAAEPIAATAGSVTKTEARFESVEEMMQVVLRFPGDRLAAFTCSFGASDASIFQVWGTKGSVRLDQAFEMVGEKELSIETMRAGKPATRSRGFGKVDQFAPLLVHLSDTVRRGAQPHPSGEEGMADIRVIEAVRRAAETGRTVRLPPMEFAGVRATRARAMSMPGHGKPDLVGARSPSR